MAGGTGGAPAGAVVVWATGGCTVRGGGGSKK